VAKDTGKKIAIGAAIAAAAGYLTGLLTAPKSGKETRKDIKDAASKFAREAEKKLKSLHTELSELIDKAEGVLKDKKANVQKGLDKAVEVAKQNQAKVKELISAVRNGETDQPELKKAIKDATKAKEHLMKFFAK
jgi:gas vesicle protein